MADYGGTMPTIQEVWEQYAAVGLTRLTPYTRDNYRKVWRLRVEPTLGAVDVDELTVADVEDWLAAILSTGLGWNTVRNARIVLSAVLTFRARREGMSRDHVARRAQLPGEEPVYRLEVPEPAVVAGVIRWLLETDPRLAVFERVAAVTGARRGELGALRLDDVKADGLHFDEAVRMEHVDRKAVLSIGATKTRERRFVECDDVTVALVHRWIDGEQITGSRSLLFAEWPCPTPCDQPHRHRFGPFGPQDPVHPERWSQQWRRACCRFGISTSQHKLRHMVATITAEQLGVRVAQARLGHARVTTTERYAHVRATQGAAAAAGMAAVLG